MLQGKRVPIGASQVGEGRILENMCFPMRGQIVTVNDVMRLSCVQNHPSGQRDIGAASNCGAHDVMQSRHHMTRSPLMSCGSVLSLLGVIKDAQSCHLHVFRILCDVQDLVVHLSSLVRRASEGGDWHTFLS